MTPGYPAPTRRQQLEACLLAALCSVLFLGNALVPGRALVPYPVQLYDVQHAEAEQRGETVELRGNVAMGDKYNQSLCWDRILHDRLRQGELPRWTNAIGGGAPFVPQMAQPYEPWSLLLLVLPAEQWYGWFVLLHQVLFGWFAYRFCRRLGCAHDSALLALTVAVLGLWTQSKLHHNVILTAALSLFPMLSAIHAIARPQPGDSRRRSVAALALWTGLSWLSGFVVVSLQASYLALAWALLLCLGNARGDRLRPLLQCGIGFALGGLLSAAQTLPVLAASAITSRTSVEPQVLAQKGLEWDYAWTAIWPDLLHWARDWFHSASEPTRPPWLSELVLLRGPDPEHGDPVGKAGYNWVECSFAIGIPGLLAALAALWDRARRGTVLLFLGTAVAGFGLATGSPPFLWPARLLPRLLATDLKRNLFLCAMGLTVLTALGADRLRDRSRLWIAAAGIAAVSAGLWIWCLCLDNNTFVDVIARLMALDQGHPMVKGHSAAEIAAMIRSAAWPEEAQVNLDALRATFARASVVAGLAAATLRWPAPRFRVPVLVAATIAELLQCGRAGVVSVPAAEVATPPRVVQPVVDATRDSHGMPPRLQRLDALHPDDKQVKTLYPPNLPAYQGLEDCAAYNPLPDARQEEFWKCIEPDEADTDKVSVVWPGAGVSWLRRARSLMHPLLDVYGVHYLLVRGSPPGIATLPIGSLVDCTPRGAAGGYRLFERPTSLPRATFVRRIAIVPDRQERLALLATFEHDARQTVVLEDANAPIPAVADAAPAVVLMRERRDERVRVDVECAADGYLRLADPYDPGWRATVDGADTTVYAADHHLRAVYLRPGHHDVVFSYDAPAVVWPPRLSAIALLAIASLWFWPRRKPA